MQERRKHNLPYRGVNRRRTHHVYDSDDGSNSNLTGDFLNNVAAIAIAESVIDTSSSAPDPTPDPTPPDFGGFGGGDSGGGGSSSSW